MTRIFQEAIACVFGLCKNIQEEPPQDIFKNKISSSLVIQSQPQQQITEYSENSAELVANFVNLAAKKMVKGRMKKQAKKKMMKKGKKKMIKKQRRALKKIRRNRRNEDRDRDRDSEEVSHKMGLIERFKRKREERHNVMQQKENKNEKLQQKQILKQQLQKAIAKVVGEKPVQKSDGIRNKKQRNRGFVKKYDGKEIDFDRGNQTEEIKTVSAEERKQYSREALQRFGLQKISRNIQNEKNVDFSDANINVKRIRRQKRMDQLPETETGKQQTQIQKERIKNTIPQQKKTVKKYQLQSMEQKNRFQPISTRSCSAGTKSLGNRYPKMVSLQKRTQQNRSLVNPEKQQLEQKPKKYNNANESVENNTKIEKTITKEESSWLKQMKYRMLEQAKINVMQQINLLQWQNKLIRTPINCGKVKQRNKKFICYPMKMYRDM